jgi:hypothetical protein
MAVSTPLALRCGAFAIAALAAAVYALAGAPAPAAAASWSCDASALRGTLATAPPFEPVTANHGAATCADSSAGGNNALAALPVGLSGGALSAATQLQAPQSTPDQQRAVATAAATDLRLVALPGQIPVPALPPGLASFSIPGGPAVDLTPAIAALLTPPAELLSVASITSRAVGQCTGGRPTLSATSAQAGLRVLGNDIASSVVDQAVTVTQGQTISLSQLDLSKVTLPGGAALPPALVAPLQTALAAAPPVALPAQVGQLTVRPGEEIRSGDRLTRRALHVTLALGGQTLLDAVLGEASVGSDSVTCGGAAQVAAEQALQCTKRRLVLVDVLQRAGRVHLMGVADRRLIGRRVAIRFVRLSTHSRGVVVARTTVGRNGVFRATAPLPARKLRRSNRARYQAVLGKERSLRLKLVRRMAITGVKPAKGRVTISGRVRGPLAAPIATIIVRRRVSCSRTVVARHVRPSRDGRFRVTLSGPPRTLAATYRFETKVRRKTTNPKLFPTFTLPRSVEFR